ncbi:hypothetical protein BC938DRAFT_484094 [Jimgerdemannia flammicorona]|uniref:Uncharacterized protein n=1 Tax=Jimgerdemannia flammicorona TaxID=994334 RepID=A0A433QAJ6_9FUNG|nr:hypothetical protein BC938DRAFT_484094 [Jimgerdemannia flammicorona]
MDNDTAFARERHVPLTRGFLELLHPPDLSCYWMTMDSSVHNSLIQHPHSFTFSPQSLVKQFDFPNLNFNYDTYDITAQFNSETNFWFTTDPQIQPGQIDLEFLVLHEFIHGLGFLSLWRDYFDRNILTPCPLTPASATKDMVGTEHFIFQGFIESAFDRHILDRTLGTNLSDYTRRMSAFSYGPGTTFKTLRIFLDEFLASSQSRMARRLFRLATTPNAMAFQSEPGARSPAAAGKRLSLETSIRQYRIGSTITHFDYGSFTGTSDFLMRWLIDDGVSLHDAIARSNVDGLEHTGSEADGIGPGVLSVLESLGYRTLLSGGVSIYKPKLPPLDHLTMTNAARRVVGGMETWAWMVGVVMVWTVGWGW